MPWTGQHCKRKWNGQHWSVGFSFFFCLGCVVLVLVCLWLCSMVGWCACLGVCVCAWEVFSAIYFLSRLLCASNSFSFAFEVVHVMSPAPTAPPDPTIPSSRPGGLVTTLPRLPFPQGKMRANKPTSASSLCRSSAAARFVISGIMSSRIFSSRRVNTRSRAFLMPIITTNIRGNRMDVCEKDLISQRIMRHASWIMVNRWTRLMGTCNINHWVQLLSVINVMLLNYNKPMLKELFIFVTLSYKKIYYIILYTILSIERDTNFFTHI